MAHAKQVYDENVGHTHEAAVNAVYAAGFADGQASGQTVTKTETVTVDPNPDLEAEIVLLKKSNEDAAAHIADLEAKLAASGHHDGRD